MVRWILVLLILAALAGIGAYWLGPGVVPHARLELLAFDATGQFSANAQLAVPDSLERGETRYALVLAARNSGQRVASPDELTLSLPGWARLLGPNGIDLESTDEGDEPLHTYRFRLNGAIVEPEALPTVIDGLEGLFLVARLPSMTCRLRWDGVPEFTPMPAYDPTLIANVEAYYALNGPRGRETGQLVLRLDPGRVVPAAGEDFQTGPVEMRAPSVALPQIGKVTLEGRRTVICGAPELRYTVESFVWRTGDAGTGRLIIVVSEGSPRRLLFDLDGDGRVELEAWDGDGDGRTEARRTASFRIPAFLIPVPPTAPAQSPVSSDSTTQPPPDTIRPALTVPANRDTVRGDTRRRDTLRADTVRRDTLRRDTLPGDTLRADTLRRDTLRRETLRRDTRVAGARGPGVSDTTGAGID